MPTEEIKMPIRGGWGRLSRVERRLQAIVSKGQP